MSDGDGGARQKTGVELHGLCSGGFWRKTMSEGDVKRGLGGGELSKHTLYIGVGEDV